MNTWHIHIGGLVQGVGFRPFVCRIAGAMQIRGTVNNGPDGVHIYCNADEEKVADFYNKLVKAPPANAIIRSHHCTITTSRHFDSFSIVASDASTKPDMLITPDIAMCSCCHEEINDPENRRYQYPFTTCLDCGPRYSIMQELPYDRSNTTMAGLSMCPECRTEYENIFEHRHYSQTNSCPHCSIPIHLFNDQGVAICHDADCILVLVNQALLDGQVVAVKGIGGYLLLCDATRKHSIQQLRDRKHRPSKPFAVMYPSIKQMEQDVLISQKEKEALKSKVAPIVLCRVNNQTLTGICADIIAPGLDKIGVMLPYTPLLALISQNFARPLIATSGNLSGSPITYTDEDALLWLTEYANLIVSFERDIVTPQDDSVVQFSSLNHEQIILRRSRGLSPNYYPVPFKSDECLLATGAEMKSAFAILDHENLYISQFLGDQSHFESQLSFKNTLYHLLHLLRAKPGHILIDSHPGYSISEAGKSLASEWRLPITTVQHHVSHFCAVLSENNLLNTDERVLGVIWDGAGYGEDRHIWGGEFFVLEDDSIERFMHLDYFPQLLGDKMNREPRISAVALLRNNMDQLMNIKHLFTATEREFYLKVIQQKQNLLTSSIGRLLDGIAAILSIQSFNTYEGEAAMKLEAVARSCQGCSMDYYPISINKHRAEWTSLIDELLRDKKDGTSIPVIARKVFISLVMLVKNVARRAGTNKIAFSGGVFQNSFLVDLLIEVLTPDHELYFHKNLSPNDECISFGQLAFYEWQKHNRMKVTNTLANNLATIKTY